MFNFDKNNINMFFKQHKKYLSTKLSFFVNQHVNPSVSLPQLFLSQIQSSTFYT